MGENIKSGISKEPLSIFNPKILFVMTKSMFKILICSFTILLNVGCEQNYINNDNTLPSAFFFTLVDANNVCLLDNSSNLKIYYFINNQKRYVNDVGVFGIDSEYEYFASSLEIALRSGDDKIKNFYLETGTDADTIFFDIQRTRGMQPDRGYYTIPVVRFNDKEPEKVETSNNIPSYFILKKE